MMIVELIVYNIFCVICIGTHIQVQFIHVSVNTILCKFMNYCTVLFDSILP